MKGNAHAIEPNAHAIEPNAHAIEPNAYAIEKNAHDIKRKGDTTICYEANNNFIKGRRQMKKNKPRVESGEYTD